MSTINPLPAVSQFKFDLARADASIADWDKLIAAQVDAIITDDPAELIAYLKSKGCGKFPEWTFCRELGAKGRIHPVTIMDQGHI